MECMGGATLGSIQEFGMEHLEQFIFATWADHCSRNLHWNAMDGDALKGINLFSDIYLAA